MSSSDNIEEMMLALGREAKSASTSLATSPVESRDRALRSAAAHLRASRAAVLAANAADLSAARAKGLSGAMLDRLELNDDRLESIAKGLESIATLADPVGKVTDSWSREEENGLTFERVRVPLGVVGVIYESRPNVTADAAGLCVKSGNAVILRGGSESTHSAREIHRCVQAGLREASIDERCVQLVPTADRAAVGVLLGKMSGLVDVIIPRGGKSLVARVQAEARVPVFSHLEGICHTYVDASADPLVAAEVVENAKLRRTGICGATETVLVDTRALKTHLGMIVDRLVAGGCEIRGDDAVRAAEPRVVVAACEEDWRTEYLDKIVSIAAVDGVAGAIAHIAEYSSNHTESVIATDPGVVQRFFREVDSAILLHNASTQFADGGQFGFGAEIGIATGKLHARGPVGVDQLTTFKYLVRAAGDMAVRP